MSSGRKNIVIVDGSQTFIMYSAILLRRMGFNVIPCENGLQAIKLLKIIGADAVMLDVGTPDMDGIKTLEYIKADAQTAGIPVIMVSVDSDAETVRKCETVGCSAYLTKPLKIERAHSALQDSIFLPVGIKRKHLRTEFNRKVYVTYKGVSEKHYAQTLSEGGMYVGTGSPLPVGSAVKISLPIKDESFLYLKGSVIYINGSYNPSSKTPAGMAVEFHDLRPEDITILKGFVKKLLVEDTGPRREAFISVD